MSMSRENAEVPDVVGHRGSAAVDRRPVVDRLLKYLAWSGLTTALSISAVLHLIALMVAANIYFGWGIGVSGGGEEDSGPVGFAVVTETELAEIQGSSLSVDAPGVTELTAQTADTKLELTDPTALSENLGGLSDAGMITGAGSDIGSSVAGSGVGGSGSGGASFFGIEAQGSRFVYIVDVSGSMSVGGKIQSLRSELARSVNDLVGNSQFLIVPFSSEARAIGGKNAWTEATDRNKRAIGSSIEALNADGGTNPSPGFLVAFALKPKPDAIYFMTDGEFSPEVVKEIAAMNRQLDIRIHCICFVSQGSEELMKTIAKQSGGTYSFVPGGGP